MKKIFCILIYCIFGILTYAEITIKIFEPIRFDDVVNETFGKTISVGTGIIEISTDNLDEDLGKKIVFSFPEKGLMTNRKKWIEIEKYQLENKDREITITGKVQQIKLYALLDKKSIDKNEEPNIIEGDYIGFIPIVISQYGQIVNGSVVE